MFLFSSFFLALEFPFMLGFFFFLFCRKPELNTLSTETEENVRYCIVIIVFLISEGVSSRLGRPCTASCLGNLASHRLRVSARDASWG